MANKVITVTNPSVVTNDTLVGYNNYSDQDGQLGTTMTPTEATNGKTITLSDGVVHEVTTKPVGTTNGEFSAVVSNAVTVDLSTSILFQDDFSGTDLAGNTNWTVTNPSVAAGLVISQNDALLLTSNTDGTTTPPNDFVRSVQGSDNNAVAIFDLTLSGQYNERWWRIGIGNGADAQDWFYLTRSQTGDVDTIDFECYIGGSKVNDVTVTLDLSTVKTVKFSYLSGVGYISYWGGSAWVELATYTATLTSEVAIVQEFAAASSGDADLMTIDNYYLCDADVLTQYP